MPCSRQRSLTCRPFSASFRIGSIWLSLNLDFLIATPSITRSQWWQKCLVVTCPLGVEAYYSIVHTGDQSVARDQAAVWGGQPWFNCRLIVIYTCETNFPCWGTKYYLSPRLFLRNWGNAKYSQGLLKTTETLLFNLYQQLLGLRNSSKQCTYLSFLLTSGNSKRLGEIAL